MQQHQFLRYLCSLVAIFCLASVDLAASSCNICQENKVKCVNETHFTFCLAGVAPNQLIGCPDGRVCTEFEHVCQPHGAPPSCSEVNRITLSAP